MPFSNTGNISKNYVDNTIKEAIGDITASTIPTSDSSDVQTKLTGISSDLADILQQLPVIKTQAEYNALPETKLTDGKLYVIVG